MEREKYRLLEEYMLRCMSDSAHDSDHVYRVLYAALDIAGTEKDVDGDRLIAACLLHDIGRQEQFADPRVDHAQVGAEKAGRFLLENGFAESFASAVCACIATHRYRMDAPPESMEAKILFDADKLDVAGAVGIARTLLYKGEVGEPLYSLRADGSVSDGAGEEPPSFFQEYKFKLEKLYSRFYTKRGAQLAEQRRAAAMAYYESLYREMCDTYTLGQGALNALLQEG